MLAQYQWSDGVARKGSRAYFTITKTKGEKMSMFGYGTLEEEIYILCDQSKYTKEQILRALLTVASTINSVDSDYRTELK